MTPSRPQWQHNIKGMPKLFIKDGKLSSAKTEKKDD